MMENTALTRQATRARIGPWYVMQSRNPSAPGMKLSTLQLLIRKGQVTAKSVVRGPTTHQLWRFAARVKGISREFGICYSCAAEIDKAAKVCPRCSRSQELPANPDALLENDPQQANKPVYIEVKDQPVETPIVEETKPEVREKPAIAAAAPVAPPIEVPSPTTTMTSLAGIASPEDAPESMRSRARQKPERILSAKELAAAFSLQYNPNADAPPSQAKPKAPKRSLARVAGGMALGILIAGGVAYCIPGVHEPVRSWAIATYQKYTAQPAASPQTPTTPAPSEHLDPSQLPNWAQKPPVVSNPVGTDTHQSPTTPSVTNPPKPAEVTPPAAVAPTPVTPAPAPAPTPTPPPAHVDTPSPVVPTLVPQNGQSLDDFAMQLRAQGMDAESKGDLRTAETCYEEVEKLSREHWPLDIDLRLRTVKKALSQ